MGMVNWLAYQIISTTKQTEVEPFGSSRRIFRTSPPLFQQQRAQVETGLNFGG